MGATIGFVSATNPANVIKASSPRPHPSLSIHLLSIEPGFLTAPKNIARVRNCPELLFVHDESHDLEAGLGRF